MKPGSSINQFSRVFAALTLVSCIAVSANAGGQDSGGGDAAVCRGNDGEETVEVLDIFEAKNRYRYQLRSFTQTDVRSILLDAWYFPLPALERVDEFKAPLDSHNLIMLESVPEIDDQGEVALPIGCVLHQLAVWDDKDDKVYVNRNLWNRLDPLNQAALLLHEVSWKGERVYGKNAFTSERIRRNVGRQFAVGQLSPIRETPAGVDSIRCTGYEVGDRDRFSGFRVWPDRDGLRFEFPLLHNHLTRDSAGFTLPVRLDQTQLQELFHAIKKRKSVSIPGLSIDREIRIAKGSWEGSKIHVILKTGQRFRIYIERVDQDLLCTFGQHERF